MRVFGLEIPDAGPVFAGVLVLHVAAGLTCVTAGTLAATAGKRRGRHPRAGRVYLYGLCVVFATATVMSAVRWPHDAHLLAVAVVASGLGLAGWWARRRRGRAWVRWHAAGMGGSFIALLTGFYVDNGPQLPGWDRLPPVVFWFLPAAVGVPLLHTAIRRFERPVTPRCGRA
ncbi:hypothetical protein Daura_30650 [Dactylosporangium aurantiacum]|uniref:DUF2306 domain-containing protein n=1 Tax=Dactylosporangium aurantiacum TaxID=35754 RepID=A0A9Q9MG08_9ACTN|nr:hypothetical protein [Dactylosporangium aurantiacum]MDG6108757.1 hypothetical protein [Dactylosporangium aurantiacum]UWZ51116.1 hypothetical protein Daura_30650 [Dactylosporangium aurantiacum]